MMTLKILTTLYRNKQSNGQRVYVIVIISNIAVVTTYSQGKINKTTQQLITSYNYYHCITLYINLLH